MPLIASDSNNRSNSQGPLSTADAKYFHGRVPTWTAFVTPPSYDAYWQARAVQRRLNAPAVATLTVGGWWDQEDRYGPLATYRALERGDTGRRNYLVMGPWNHGGGGGGGGGPEAGGGSGDPRARL